VHYRKKRKGSYLNRADYMKLCTQVLNEISFFILDFYVVNVYVLCVSSWLRKCIMLATYFWKCRQKLCSILLIRKEISTRKEMSKYYKYLISRNNSLKRFTLTRTHSFASCVILDRRAEVEHCLLLKTRVFRSFQTSDETIRRNAIFCIITKNG
jgi:hypothetical protein